MESEITVRQFTSGFTQAMASFDFIDVGSGKERADTKIKGESRSVSLLSCHAAGQWRRRPVSLSALLDLVGNVSHVERLLRL